MEKQLTVVEWLIIQFSKYCDDSQVPFKVIEQAKEMEKEQIIKAHFDGQCDETEGYPIEIAEQYYNETFKSE